MKPLLSIVIPTYNRYEYLFHSIDSILSIDSDSFELIVQDNTLDNSRILDYLADTHDERLKYFHNVKHVSMMENCDDGVSHANGEFVCVLGDDDSICQNLISATKFCKENKIEACNFLMACFNWPDMTFKDRQEPNLFCLEKASGSVLLYNPKVELDLSLKSGRGLLLSMPKAYHGLVSMDCMNRIKNATGSYFPGPSPDMANAACVCLESKKTAFIFDYLIISGYGYNSARGQGNRLSGNTKENP